MEGGKETAWLVRVSLQDFIGSLRTVHSRLPISLQSSFLTPLILVSFTSFHFLIVNGTIINLCHSLLFCSVQNQPASRLSLKWIFSHTVYFKISF